MIKCYLNYKQKSSIIYYFFDAPIAGGYIQKFAVLGFFALPWLFEKKDGGHVEVIKALNDLFNLIALIKLVNSISEKYIIVPTETNNSHFSSQTAIFLPTCLNKTIGVPVMTS